MNQGTDGRVEQHSSDPCNSSGVEESGLVEQLKADMTGGHYAFAESRGQIAGLRDQRGTYHIVEGHHRMIAAMELYQETGDATAALALLQWGRWTAVDRCPSDSRPLPSRKWWGALRNRLGF